MVDSYQSRLSSRVGASRARLAVGFLALLVALFIGGGVAFAAGGEAPHASRITFSLLSIALMVGGFLLARIHKGTFELSKSSKLMRGVGVTLAAIGTYFLIYSVTAPAPSTSNTLEWIYDINAAKAKSAEEGKPVMVDFRADWCVACGELEAEVFKNPDVAPRLTRDFVLLKVDMDQETEANKAIADRFEVSGLPHVSFLSSDDKELRNATFTGMVTVEEFNKHLEAALTGASVEKDNTFSKTLGEQGLLAALLVVFLAGVASSLTPCVYPLIPITIGILGARESKSKLDSFLVSVVYVLGIGITYTALGVTAALLGTVFGGAMQSPWVMAAIALVFFVLGLSSLGLFEIRLPNSLQTTLSQKGGAGYLGALVMGLVAGIIAAPCVGPIVAGVLVYVAQQQDVVLGSVLLFTFAMGMGLLFIVLGTFSGLLSRLPRSGGWMEGVKVVIGTIFIGVALYYAGVLLPNLRGLADQIWLLVG